MWLIKFCLMNIIHILQGSNEGDRLNYLDTSVQKIEENIGKISKYSSIYESEPWGFETNLWFLNRVVVVETSLVPEVVLSKLLNIETELGRNRFSDGVYHSRTLDLDILFVGKEIISTTNLIVPHPQLQNRKFTLLPLAEISPQFIHPSLNKTMIELLAQCTDKSKVQIFQKSWLIKPIKDEKLHTQTNESFF